MHVHTINTRPYFSPAVILAKNRPGDGATGMGESKVELRYKLSMAVQHGCMPMGPAQDQSINRPMPAHVSSSSVL